MSAVGPPVHPDEAQASHSGFSLTPTFRADLDRLRQDCNNAMAELKREGDKLKGCLQQLEIKQATLKRRISGLDAALAPHKKLPPEILSHIFTLSRQDTTIRIYPPSSSSRSSAPGRPDHVCSLWRQIALTTPALWKVVVVHYERLCDAPLIKSSTEFHTTIRDMTAFASGILLRGVRSLCILFGSTPHKWLETDLAKDLLRSLILPVSSRLENLEVLQSGLSQDFLHIFTEIIPTLPRLEHLSATFSINSGDYLPLLNKPLDNLCHLDLYDGSLPDPIRLSEEGLYQILSCCPNLKQCSACISCDGCLPGAHLDPLFRGKVLLEFLQGFEFHRDDCEHEPASDPMSLLRHLVLPSLRHLEIFHGQLSNGRDILKDLIERSQCNIQNLLVGRLLPEANSIWVGRIFFTPSPNLSR